MHSGSTLFSGDAGGGESETRRWLLQEQDMVEAIIQLPKNEFFNTGIHTYLWVLNRAKPASRKGFVLLVNAESCFTKLKRNLNMKNCEIDAASRERIRASKLSSCMGGQSAATTTCLPPSISEFSVWQNSCWKVRP